MNIIARCIELEYYNYYTGENGQLMIKNGPCHFVHEYKFLYKSLKPIYFTIRTQMNNNNICLSVRRIIRNRIGLHQSLIW